MLPLVEVRRSFFVGKIMRFIYTVLIIFAILLCATFYIMNNMEFGGNPTLEVTQTSIITIEPPVVEETDFLGDVTPPNLELFEKITQSTHSNPDTVGWLSVNNTNIDYPVVQSKDNDYYLRRGFDGRYKFAGTLFADFRVSGKNRTDFYRNTVIYGHNINQNHNVIKGEMFAHLMKYKDLEFVQNNQYIYYSTPEDEITWEIFSIFYNGEKPDGEPDFYHIEIDTLNDDETYKAFLNEAISRSEYDFSVEVGVEDKIITLSTCTYKYGLDLQQYFVVMARIVGDNDDSNIKNVTINEDKKTSDFLIENNLI